MDIADDDLLWWLGVLHTDCYIHKKDGNFKELRLRVGKDSMDMLIKWKTYLDVLTDKEHKIHKENYFDKRTKKISVSYCAREGSRKSLGHLLELIPSKRFHFNSIFASWLQTNSFGPYLAGVIDGDGCFQIRKSNSSSGYQRLLKIADKDSEKLLAIQQLLLKNNMPKGYITEYSNHSDLWIYINKRFNKWLIANVLPHMAITRKKNKCLGSPGGEG